MTNFVYFLGFLFFGELVAFGIGRHILKIFMPGNTYLSKKFLWDLIRIFFLVGAVGFLVFEFFI